MLVIITDGVVIFPRNEFFVELHFLDYRDSRARWDPTLPIDFPKAIFKLW